MDSCGMDERARQEHADLLRKAIEEAGQGMRRTVSDSTGRSYRTVGNWTARTNPTMPSAAERATLRQILGPYDSTGDPVERALRQSELVEWRQDAVLSFYKRNLHEQEQAETG